MSADVSKTDLRQSLARWIEEHLPGVTSDIDVERVLPTVTDFILVVASEDAGDADAEAYYSFVTNGASYHHAIGLLAVAKRAFGEDD